MKRTIQLCMVVGLVVFVAGQSSATDKQNPEGSTLSHLQRQVMEVEAQGKVLLVKLKNGKSVNGRLVWVSNEEFIVTRTRGALDRFVGQPEAEKFAYSLVVAIKQPNGFLTLLRKAGEYSAATAGYSVGIPAVLVLSIIDSLLGTDILPDC